MKKILILLSVLVIFGCTKEGDDAIDVQIRVANVSDFDYKNIMINVGSGNNFFEDLDAGQTSNYQVFDYAYWYGNVGLNIDGDTFSIQIIDYVGETPLSNGKYTFEINANNSQDQFGKLTSEMIKN